jgi:mannose-6-phosphate isomerase-like protein (cupin superfamily)
MPSNFSHKNFKDDIPDAAADRDEDVEGHFGRSALDAEQIGVSYWRYGPNFSAPFGHSHEVQEEAYVVVSGSGRMKIDDEIIELRQWDVVRVAPKAIRGFRSGADGLELIAVGGNRPPDGDGKMQPDFWTED